jgi:hypothetical protein
MIQVKIKDGSFPQSNSATMAGDNSDCKPKHFEWLRDDSLDGTIFFTDICLHLALNCKANKKIAWLLEPQEINPTSYKFCIGNEDIFDYILTYDREYLSCGDIQKWLFYPFAGSWIKPEHWKMWSKSKLVSLIASEKSLTFGHKFRHKIVDKFSDIVDVMGRGYVPIQSKTQGLIPYYYSIVVENTKRDWWFTEKLIDCFSTGTVPIYWGCEDLGKWFDTNGIIFFDELSDLEEILGKVGEDDYRERMDSIKANLGLAQNYRCVEDWLFKHYRFLFEEEK